MRLNFNEAYMCRLEMTNERNTKYTGSVYLFEYFNFIFT